MVKVSETKPVKLRGTEQLENLNYASALELIEKMFWDFCDDFIEIVKARAYQEANPGAISAKYALNFSIGIFLRLLAPYMPYITEELWSQQGLLGKSIHNSPWPNKSEFSHFNSEQKKIWFLCQNIVREIRQQKASKNMGVGYGIKKLTITSDPRTILSIKDFESDLINVSRVLQDGFTLQEARENMDASRYKLTIEG